jgi:outer membrane protein assembly factor BamB
MIRIIAIALFVTMCPAFGQKQLWKRALGEGYSGIAADGTSLYTMYRSGSDEVATALDAATGKTRWEYKYAAALLPNMGMENGPGPHTTPLVLGDHVYTIGVLARMHAFNKNSGKVVWTKDLYKDFPGSTFMGRGYSSSPIAYKNTVIVKLGGANHAIVALNSKDGSVVWQKHSYDNSPSTPTIVMMNGQEQLLASFANEIVGMNPNNGDLLWSHPHRTRWGLNISTPVTGPNNVVLITSAYDGGARAIQVSSSGAKELWHTNRMRVHIGNTVANGTTVYGSSGDFGPAPVTAIDLGSGQVLWQDRTFSKANFVRKGDRTIVLDEDGVLGVVSLTPKGMQVHSKTPVLSSNAWTIPTLAGTKLYARDRREIVALEMP